MRTNRPASLDGLPLLEDLGDLHGKHVLVRVDFNVPMRDGHIVDDFRMRSALPTIEWLQAQGANVTLCTHMGRPNGQPDPKWSVEPLRARLGELAPGVELLENLRFQPGEEANDPAFVAELIAGVDAYVNDAFGVSHRSHASVVGPPQFLPAAAGRLVEAEVETLGGLLHSPRRPFVAVVGGAKVADKLGILESLATKVDILVVGGAMAFTFLKAMGHEIGGSLVDLDKLDACRALLASATEIVLPDDIVALEPGAKFGPEFNGTTPAAQVKTFDRDLPDGWIGLDVGPETIANLAVILARAGTILWNGPVGAFEDERFSAGTRAVAEAVASSPAFSVIGGGDSASALTQMGLADQVDFLSTGGGASLEFIEHGDLPALAALRHAKNAPAPK